MKRTLIKQRIGEDSIWTACTANGNAAILLGTFNLNGKYGIVLAEMDIGGKILWKKTHEMHCNCEANAILRERNGYLIAGNACGIPTEHGGSGWKAYMLRTDREGNPVLERTYELGDNDAIYSIVRSGDEIICMGETERKGEKYIFLMVTDYRLNTLKKRYYGPYENVLVGGISGNLMAHSFLHKGKWHGRIVEIGENPGIDVTIAELDDVQIYSIDFSDGELFVSGEKYGEAYAAKISGNGDMIENIMGTGVITGIKAHRNGVILVGDFEAVPYVTILDRDMNVISERVETEASGWLEDLCLIGGSILSVGYSMKDMKALALLLERTAYNP